MNFILVQPLGQRGRFGRLDDQPGGPAVVHYARIEFDAALHAQEQQLTGLTGLEVGDLLGGQRVEPAQAVRSGDRHHAAVGKIDDGGTGREGALLPQRFAVVGRDAGVGAARFNGARARQQRALGSHMKGNVLGWEGIPAT